MTPVPPGQYTARVTGWDFGRPGDGPAVFDVWFALAGAIGDAGEEHPLPPHVSPEGGGEYRAAVYLGPDSPPTLAALGADVAAEGFRLDRLDPRNDEAIDLTGRPLVVIADGQGGFRLDASPSATENGSPPGPSVTEGGDHTAPATEDSDRPSEISVTEADIKIGVKGGIRLDGTSTPVNRHSSLVAEAKRQRSLGRGIVWLNEATKRPYRTGWTTKTQEPGQGRPGDNLGLLTGTLSGGLCCVDLDGANALALADEYLPRTAMIDGRRSKQRGHRWFVVHSVPPHAVSNAAGGRLGGPRTRRNIRAAIDFLASGAQCVIPPSVHSSGEVREWVSDGPPTVLPFATLWEAVQALATACGFPFDDKSRRRSGDGPADERSVHLARDRLSRARAYLADVPPAVAGQKGNARTYAAACRLVHGFALTPAEAFPLLQEWNARCRPPWGEDALWAKLAAADDDASAVRGALLTQAERESLATRQRQRNRLLTGEAGDGPIDPVALARIIRLAERKGSISPGDVVAGVTYFRPSAALARRALEQLAAEGRMVRDPDRERYSLFPYRDGASTMTGDERLPGLPAPTERLIHFPAPCPACRWPIRLRADRLGRGYQSCPCVDPHLGFTPREEAPRLAVAAVYDGPRLDDAGHARFLALQRLATAIADERAISGLPVDDARQEAAQALATAVAEGKTDSEVEEVIRRRLDTLRRRASREARRRDYTPVTSLALDEDGDEWGLNPVDPNALPPDFTPADLGPGAELWALAGEILSPLEYAVVDAEFVRELPQWAIADELTGGDRKAFENARMRAIRKLRECSMSLDIIEANTSNSATLPVGEALPWAS